jgi:hypothetical protein
MREAAGSTPGLDFYLLCEPICVSLRLIKNKDAFRTSWREKLSLYEKVEFLVA